MVWEGGSRKRSRPPPVKWSDTGCLTTMPPGRWMFSVLSGSSNKCQKLGGWLLPKFPCPDARFSIVLEGAEVLSTSHLILPPSFPRSASCASPISATCVTCSQHLAHNQVLRQRRWRKIVSRRFWSHKSHAHTSLCQELFTQSQCFRRLGVWETRAGSRPTSKMA